MNNIRDINNQICSGCGSCIHICPRKAIAYVQKDGFFRAEVDENKCISCGLCKNYCYRFKKINESFFDDSKIFCVKNKNSEILKKSSSGGASNALMNALLDEGYIVYSFEYLKEEKLLMLSKAKNKNEALKFIGSKYMQSVSYRKEIYDELLKFSKDTKLAFFGTPCFVSGMKLFLENKGFTNLFFVDIFCHGTPSILLWQKYISSFGEVKEETFRDKRYGWHNYSSSFEKHGKSYCKKNDKFYSLYFSNLLMNESCYDCNIRTKFNSDIRIGDAWGYSYDTDKQGVSLLVCISEKGNDLLQKVGNDLSFLKPIQLSEIKQFQSIYQKRKTDNKKREKLLFSLNESFDSCYKSYINGMSFNEKASYFFKKIFNKFPYSIKRAITKYSHKKCNR